MTDTPESAIPEYLVRHYSAHLAEWPEATAEDWAALTRDGWRQAWFRLEGAYDGFLGDVQQAWRQLEQMDQQALAAGRKAPCLGLEVRCALIHSSIHSLSRNIPAALIEGLVKHGVWTVEQGWRYARGKPDSADRFDVFRRLIPFLPQENNNVRLAEALAVAGGIRNGGDRAKALQSVVPYLSEILLAEALAVARSIESKWERAEALQCLVSYLPEAKRIDVLIEASGSWNGESNWKHVKGLEILDAVSAVEEANGMVGRIETARAVEEPFWRAKVLGSLGPHLPKMQQAEVLTEALEAARAEKDPWLRAEALGSLVPHLPKMQRVEVLAEALEAVRLIEEEDYRIDVLQSLAPHLPEALLMEALTAAQAFNDKEERALVLQSLMSYLPEMKQTKFEKGDSVTSWAVRDQADDEGCGSKLNYYASRLLKAKRTEVLEEVFSATLAEAAGENIWDVNSLAKALHSPEACLPEGMLATALMVASDFGTDQDCAEALYFLVPLTPKSLLVMALSVAQAIEGKWDRAKVLQSFGQRLGELLNLSKVKRQIMPPWHSGYRGPGKSRGSSPAASARSAGRK